MGWVFGLVVVLVAAPWVAMAQEVDISASGTVMVLPDEFVACVRAQATAHDAAVAQVAVNRLMAAGLKMARLEAGVEATTGDFTVDEESGQDGSVLSSSAVGYQASQALNLVVMTPDGVPAPGFLALVGQLQKQGFLLESLGGDLSDGARAKAMTGAIADAMGAVGDEAGAVARALHEVVGAYKSVTVGQSSPVPIEGRRMMMPAAMAPAVAAPGTLTVEADVQAVVGLKPGG